MRYAHSSSGTTRAIRVGLARIDSTQGALAAHLKLSQPAIHRRMSGKVAWRVDELREAAAFLGTSISELVGDEKASA
ncbi:helix-turn-helix transcriptional regulator [Mycobacterium sp.]|uniref:helix-turn-helix domain-containing protein n=1 Tax=Mycobacterium sp. TaxID=1785 RepID=UPI0025DB2FEC|nr:helix-turn-helix transcriptional regulator [Mycobacterium sp.]